MQRTTRQFTISLPTELAEQVSALAKFESRTISEMFRESFRAYRAQRVRTLLDRAQEIGRRSNPMGYTADDVERLIHETRLEQDSESGD